MDEYVTVKLFYFVKMLIYNILSRRQLEQSIILIFRHLIRVFDEAFSKIRFSFILKQKCIKNILRIIRP